MLNNLFRIHVKFHELLRIFLHFIIQIINLSIYISSIIIITLFFHISHKLPNSLTAKEITRQLNNYHAQIVTRNKSSQSTIKTFSLSSTNTNISKRHSRTSLYAETQNPYVGTVEFFSQRIINYSRNIFHCRGPFSTTSYVPFVISRGLERTEQKENTKEQAVKGVKSREPCTTAST